MKKMVLAALLSVLALNVNAVTGEEANGQKGGSGCAPTQFILFSALANNTKEIFEAMVFEASDIPAQIGEYGKELGAQVDASLFGPDVHGEVEEMLRF